MVQPRMCPSRGRAGAGNGVYSTLVFNRNPQSDSHRGGSQWETGDLAIGMMVDLRRAWGTTLHHLTLSRLLLKTDLVVSSSSSPYLSRPLRRM